MQDELLKKVDDVKPLVSLVVILIFEGMKMPASMINTDEITGIIRDYCRQHASEANVVRYSRYFKSGYDAYGLSQPQMEAGAKEMLKLPGINLDLVLEAAPELMKSGKYEETGLMLLLVRGLHKHYTRETFHRIAGWYQIGIRNWAHADTLGMTILPVFLKKEIIFPDDFRDWLTAGFKFQRRCVPVSFIKLLKTHPEYPALFSFTECLMEDPDREVHQGMGWFLREAWKKNAPVTETFLLKWKNSAPRLIIQYATEKMTAEEKKRFKK
jgi:3-methyladenine DNA glycosylase AlkD